MTHTTPPTTEGPATEGSAIERSAIHLSDIVVVRDGSQLLGPISWTVRADERWVVLGLNGCGKSTLLKVGSFNLHPTKGTVRILGEELGRTDVRRLRPRVGYSSAALANSFRQTITARDAVMTARHGALEPWWHTYEDEDRERAVALLAEFGCEVMADRAFNTLSSGERQRVLLARTLMTDPALVLLDEPTAALDLAGRETLMRDLSQLASGSDGPALALVTHHVEEIPPSFTHVLLMKAGEEVASGPIEETLTAETLSDTFGLDLALERRGDRWLAFATDTHS